MNIDKERIPHLYQQYLSNKLTAEEELDWKAVLADESLQDTLKALIDASYYVLPESELQDMGPERSEEIFQYISQQGDVKTLKRMRWQNIAAAAAVILVLGLGIGFYQYRIQGETSSRNEMVNDIEPGKNRATLKLADGKLIELSSTQQAILIQNKNLAYQDGSSLTKTKSIAQGDLSLSTPRGGTYQVVLPDGTKVWLNSASTLSFPADFSGASQRRLVKLSGEAYFEVAKDQLHPFVVATASQNVEVLGTHFNLNSYPGEELTTTTLLEGRVHISGKGIGGDLLPGQQSLLQSKNNKFSIVPANLKSAVAWKNGYFRFDDERIDEIMHKLSRWYDIEVVYEGVVSTEKFSGNISRNINISEVLNMLSYSGDVRFRVEGRRVTVMK